MTAGPKTEALAMIRALAMMDAVLRNDEKANTIPLIKSKSYSVTV